MAASESEVQKVVAAILAMYALPADVLQSTTRSKPRFVTEARHVAAYIVATELKYTHKAIAESLGYGRRTSAARGIETIRTVCEVDKTYRQRVANIIATLRKQNLLPLCSPTPQTS